MAGVLRALAIGVGCCLVVMVSWVTLFVARSGRWEHALHNIPDVAVSFTAAFAATAVVLFVPAFLTVDRVSDARSRRPTLLSAGALLAVVPYVVWRVPFAESEDPQTVLGWFQLWARRPEPLLMGLPPFMLAGASFGFVWWKSVKPRPDMQDTSGLAVAARR